MTVTTQIRDSEAQVFAGLEQFGLSILRHDPQFRSIFENATAGLVLASLEGAIIEVNPSFARFLGVTSEELETHNILELTHPEDRLATETAISKPLQNPTEPLTLEKRYLTKDGRTRWGHVTFSCLYDQAGKPTCLLAMIQDIQSLKEVEERLRAAEHFWKSLLDNMDDAVHIIDARTGKIAWANASFLREAGKTLQAIVGKNCHEISFAHSNAQMSPDECCPLQEVISTGEPIRAEHRIEDADGKDRFLEVSLSPIHGKEGHLETVIYVSRDVTRRRRAELEAQQLTFNDPLTGLGNRTMLLEQLGREISAAKRQGHKAALYILDFDFFKKVNKTLGHSASDELVRTLAQRLRQSVRNSDTLARIGNDEFALITPDVDELRDTTVFARKLLDIFKEPFTLPGLEIFVTPSIGIALFPQDGQGVIELCKSAELALDQARESGQTYHYYSKKLNRTAKNRLILENDLRRAIELGQLYLAYQPQIDLDTGKPFGVEALVRWQHPERGLISPADFIPLAEESGYILPLSEWILRTACTQASAWRGQGLPPLQMAVNLSGCQCRDTGLPDLVQQVLAETGLPHGFLELELTEGILMDTRGRTCGLIDELKKIGVRIAIDDFGTGYSSLAYLKNFAADRIKIAREFILDLDDRGNRAIVETMLAMGRNLGMQVLAEGVEKKDQLDFLKDHGCREVQGFYYSKPLTAIELAGFMATFGSDRKIVPLSEHRPED